MQMACLGDIVLRVESLMEATKGGVSFGQIAGGCSTQVDEAAAYCFQPARSTHVVYESEMQPVGLESCERNGGSNYRGSRPEKSKYRGSAVAFQRCGCLAGGRSKAKLANS